MKHFSFAILSALLLTTATFAESSARTLNDCIQQSNLEDQKTTDSCFNSVMKAEPNSMDYYIAKEEMTDNPEAVLKYSTEGLTLQEGTNQQKAMLYVARAWAYIQQIQDLQSKSKNDVEVAAKIKELQAKATNDLDQAMRLYPSYANIYRDRADLLDTEGHYDQAQAALENYIQDYPAVPDGYTNLSYWYGEPNHQYFKKAASVAKKGLRKKSIFAGNPGQKAWLYNNFAFNDAMSSNKNYTQDIQFAQKGIQLAPKNSTIYQSLIQIYLMRNNPSDIEKARALVQQYKDQYKDQAGSALDLIASIKEGLQPKFKSDPGLEKRVDDFIASYKK